MVEYDPSLAELRRTRDLVERPTPRAAPSQPRYTIMDCVPATLPSTAASCAYDNGASWLALAGLPRASVSPIRPGQIALILGAGAMVIGAVMPWTSGLLAVSGTQGDGLLTLTAALVLTLCALALARNLQSLGAVVAIVVAAGCGIIAFHDGRSLAHHHFLGPGVGLYVTGAGAFIALVGGLIGLIRRDY